MRLITKVAGKGGQTPLSARQQRPAYHRRAALLLSNQSSRKTDKFTINCKTATSGRLATKKVCKLFHKKKQVCKLRHSPFTPHEGCRNTNHAETTLAHIQTSMKTTTAILEALRVADLHVIFLLPFVSRMVVQVILDWKK